MFFSANIGSGSIIIKRKTNTISSVFFNFGYQPIFSPSVLLFLPTPLPISRKWIQPDKLMSVRLKHCSDFQYRTGFAILPFLMSI